MLRAQATATEKRRRISDELAQDFRAAGLFRVLQPKRYGGYEMEYGVHMRLAFELGRGCASSAWVVSVIDSHPWILGMFPDEAQAEVWGKDHDTLVSTSFLPVDPKVERVAGWIVVSGRWKFSSGIDLCSWAMPLLAVPNPAGGPPDMCLALLPLSEAKVEDTWYVSGLAGSGSNDFVVERVFIPDHRILSIAHLRGSPTPGSVVNSSYLYRLPLWTCFPLTTGGAAIGAALGAVDGIVEGLTGRKSIAQVKLAEQQSVQMRIARAAAQAETAQGSMLGIMGQLNRAGREDLTMTTLERVGVRLKVGFAVDLCVQAMETLLPLLGGRGLINTDPVQRAWRDVHAVAQHIALVWDVQAGLYGPVRLGLPCPDPKI
jgi:alkylation response protein AidB-like acyl-CoA dehydrogenase